MSDPFSNSASVDMYGQRHTTSGQAPHPQTGAGHRVQPRGGDGHGTHTPDAIQRNEPIGREQDGGKIQTASQGSTSHERSANAENAMSEDAKNRIVKNEGKDGKRVMKVLKDQARAEDNLLKSKIKELGRHQKVHKQAAKDEASALSMHSKAVKAEQKLNMSFLDARAKHESAIAGLKSKEDAVQATKGHAQQQTQLLKEKQREVDGMRERKAVDDREREAKIKQLSTNPASVTAT